MVMGYRELGMGHGAWGMGNWELGMGHGAWGIGHGELGMGHWVFAPSFKWEIESY